MRNAGVDEMALRSEAQRCMNRLKMELGPLNTLTKRFVYNNGMEITCRHCFGKEDVWVKLPEVVAEATPLEVVEETVVTICLSEYPQVRMYDGSIVMSDISGEPVVDSPSYSFLPMASAAYFFSADPTYKSWLPSSNGYVVGGMRHICINENSESFVKNGELATANQNWQDGLGDILTWHWHGDRYAWGACSQELYDVDGLQIIAPAIIRGCGVRTFRESDVVVQKNIIVSAIDGDFWEYGYTASSPKIKQWVKLKTPEGADFATNPLGIAMVPLPVFFTHSSDKAFCMYDTFWAEEIKQYDVDGSTVVSVQNAMYLQSSQARIPVYTFSFSTNVSTVSVDGVNTNIYSSAVTETVYEEKDSNTYYSYPNYSGSLSVGVGGYAKRRLIYVDAAEDIKKMYRNDGAMSECVTPIPFDYSSWNPIGGPDQATIWMWGYENTQRMVAESAPNGMVSYWALDTDGTSWIQVISQPGGGHYNIGDIYYAMYTPASNLHVFRGTSFDDGEKIYPISGFWANLYGPPQAGSATLAALLTNAIEYYVDSSPPLKLPVVIDLRRRSPVIANIDATPAGIINADYSFMIKMVVCDEVVKSFPDRVTWQSAYPRFCYNLKTPYITNDPNISFGYLYRIDTGEEYIFISWRYDEDKVVTYYNRPIVDMSGDADMYFNSMASGNRFFDTSKQYFVTGYRNAKMVNGVLQT